MKYNLEYFFKYLMILFVWNVCNLQTALIFGSLNMLFKKVLTRLLLAIN